MLLIRARRVVLVYYRLMGKTEAGLGGLLLGDELREASYGAPRIMFTETTRGKLVSLLSGPLPLTNISRSLRLTDLNLPGWFVGWLDHLNFRGTRETVMICPTIASVPSDIRSDRLAVELAALRISWANLTVQDDIQALATTAGDLTANMRSGDDTGKITRIFKSEGDVTAAENKPFYRIASASPTLARTREHGLLVEHAKALMNPIGSTEILLFEIAINNLYEN